MSTTAPAGGASGTTGTASSTLATILVRAVTEERHAKATYDNVIAALGNIAPFSNVSASEATHITTLEALARDHGVDVSAAVGSGEPAPATKALACQLGVTLEKAQIAFYDGVIPQVSAYPDAVRVFTNLRAASNDSHLPAFEHCS